jgi:hypothetical protein
MSNFFLLYIMALKSEIRGKGYWKEIISTNKWARIVISMSIGFIAGLSLFLVINTIFAAPLLPMPSSPSVLPVSSHSAAEDGEAVALCKAGVIKYTPLGAYPGGSDDVKAALNYCDNLS